MDVQLPFIVSPAFTFTPRRSGKKADAASQILSGRWVVINADNQLAYPGSGRAGGAGLYWVLEGTHNHVGTNLEFDGSSKASTNADLLPSVAAQGAIGLAYGVFVGNVGPEGCDPAMEVEVGDALEIDQYGRLVPFYEGEKIAIVEAITTNDDGVTRLVFRALGK